MNAVRVVKVGGSLFDYEHLAPALRKWLTLQPPLATVLIAGGGPFADAIRAADARFGLGEEASHWLCVSTLGVTAQLLAALLPEAEFESVGVGSLVRRMESTDRNEFRPLFVFDPEPFLRSEESQIVNPLPHTWSVTSDSIAARVAEVLEATELVLLKSSPASAYVTRDEAAQSGYVDKYFPRAAEKLTYVRVVSLRDKEYEEIRLIFTTHSVGSST